GGRIMGGVATGLAVGAGVMAAEAIGRNLMGNHDSTGNRGGNFSNNDYQPVDSNQDMGGANFGVSDSGSWDDGGGSDAGGGDW
ncbi:MAG: tetratricopeptide repeat protein, partial [Rhodoferax sp.]